MLYAILIYGNEEFFERMPEDLMEQCLEKHRGLQSKYTQQQALIATAQLMHSNTAVTVQSNREKVVTLDGPFAETKEQFLGFYLLDCESLNEAIDAAKSLPVEYNSIEVRPVNWAGGNAVKDRQDIGDMCHSKN